MARAHLERANAFWAEMSACEHFVQIYEAEEVFMDILASFVSEALKKVMWQFSLRRPLTGKS
jgi:hypothetical protein